MYSHFKIRIFSTMSTALRIQCSTQYKQALGEWNQFVLIKRGSVKVKVRVTFAGVSWNEFCSV